MADALEEVIEEQQRTLGFSVVASTIVLNLLNMVGRTLIDPAVAIDLDNLSRVERDEMLEQLHAAAVAAKEAISLDLHVHAVIEEAVGIARGEEG